MLLAKRILREEDCRRIYYKSTNNFREASYKIQKLNYDINERFYVVILQIEKDTRKLILRNVRKDRNIMFQ